MASMVGDELMAQFPNVYCPGCKATKPMTFDVMRANAINDHDAADIVCRDCNLIVATLHADKAA